ncbi:sigma-70 family RNA polymerase sigma factor [Halomonas organivorans]|uniref:RNA polymerase sigma-70 factor (ECF subfamily) n=1 Tax=Halomonas organivorans TaxID=257772 RepID=A0A7W5BZ44_9GAMM|nr:sigma-70 family RNA polymerase sigma factor [Halomonas organivorans]MBB3140848.1 RNA polymerase sigma-70 factor (ECF subfamily) [Halomonas organivorans]
MSDPSQRLLDDLAGCARGEHRALSRLYRATSARLYAQLLRIVREETAAQDCLQQVYLRAWQSADHYDPDRARPMTWLSTLARNVGIDWLRRRRPEGDEAAVDALDGGHRPEDDSVALQSAQALHDCLAVLGQEQRQAMELAYFQGLTHGELAERVAQPLGTVKSWIRRGLERLKSCLTNGI